jgi:phosphoenolpyruvate-protein kinase (PTS system EI component)
MVNDVGDVARLRDFLSEPGADGPVEIGVMIETPAAALLADQLAAVVEFFSLGTNDLTQYVLAADRESASSVTTYCPLHPAVLRLVQTSALAASRRSVPVSICGELAADQLAVPLLIGMGITGLTVPPADVARIKRVVRSTSASAGRGLVQDVLSLQTAGEVRVRLESCQPTAEGGRRTAVR